jgi:hypothetical protein
MRSGDFRSVVANNVVKIFERARRKVDVSLGRYEWRALQTLKSSVPDAKAFQFRPPQSMRWALIERSPAA